MAAIPPEIKGWNWGAFLLNWIWGIGNQTFIALLCLIPLVNVVMIFVLGAKGNAWAWQNKKWESVEHFKRVQRTWTIVGLVIIGVSILLGIGAGVMGFYAATQSSGDNAYSAQTPAAPDGQQPSDAVAGTTATSSFNFLGTQYVFGDDLSDASQNYFEFLPQGETFDNWQTLVTLVRDETLPGTATLSDADAAAQSTLQQLKAKGAFVYNAFTTSSTAEGPMDVMTVVFSEPGKSEVDLKKIFLDQDGYVESATYGVTITGSSTAEITQKVNAFLGQTSSIGPQFIDMQFPEPWN